MPRERVPGLGAGRGCCVQPRRPGGRDVFVAGRSRNADAGEVLCSVVHTFVGHERDDAPDATCKEGHAGSGVETAGGCELLVGQVFFGVCPAAAAVDDGMQVHVAGSGASGSSLAERRTADWIPCRGRGVHRRQGSSRLSSRLYGPYAALRI